MSLPGVPDDFKFPEDPGDLLAWMKNFAKKLPLYAKQLGVTDAELLTVEMMYDEMRESKDETDKLRLKVVKQKLCNVPNGWPAPPVMMELMEKIPQIDEPKRTRMIEEVESWCGAIVAADSVRPLLVLVPGYFDRGITLTPTLDAPCEWVRYYYRKAGAAAWDLLCVTRGAYYLHTDRTPEEDEEVLEGMLEFMAIGMLGNDDVSKAPQELWGPPSAMVRMAVRARGDEVTRE